MKSLLANAKLTKNKEREVRKEGELKLQYLVLKQWSDYTKIQATEREKQLVQFLKHRHLNKWKLLIKMKTYKLNNKIRAVKHFQAKVKKAYLKQLFQLSSYEKIILGLNLVAARKFFNKWQKKRTTRHFLRKVFRDSALFYKERRKAVLQYLSLIHICRCRRYAVCRSRWSPYH
eukprot:TRINITY_DN13264_c0_g3_i1.p1 TRINITY_DN13264_c0_g3~~TRINITY_DN13264_c0_g3_i1.p1  ORF type:complete len:174 (-),score=35.73 TRINITY_DN13264_c0_g3_i1:20-541(-)